MTELLVNFTREKIDLIVTEEIILQSMIIWLQNFRFSENILAFPHNRPGENSILITGLQIYII